MTQERLTSQKQITLDYLMGVKTHPTAEDVYKNVKKKLPRISRGTVYRILNGFEKKGLVQVVLSGNKAHFDGNIFPHAHFICQKCFKVYDVFGLCSKCNVLKNKSASWRTKVGKINYYRIYFYGECKKCKSSKKRGS